MPSHSPASIAAVKLLDGLFENEPLQLAKLLAKLAGSLDTGTETADGR